MKDFYMFKTVALNKNSRRIGESHLSSILTVEQVDRIRDLLQDHYLTCKQLAEMFQTPKTNITTICQYFPNVQTPFGWKTLKVQ